MIGIIDPVCSPRKVIEKCTQAASKMFETQFNTTPPQVITDGALHATFPYITQHIEYLVFEVKTS